MKATNREEAPRIAKPSRRAPGETPGYPRRLIRPEWTYNQRIKLREFHWKLWVQWDNSCPCLGCKIETIDCYSPCKRQVAWRDNEPKLSKEDMR